MHSYGLTSGQPIIICFYMMGLGDNLTMRGLSRRGIKKERVGLIRLSALWGAAEQKFAHSLHPEKIPPLPWKNPPVSRLPLPVLANTKLLFPQASKPKALNWYRQNSTMVSTPPPIIMGRGGGYLI